MLNELKLKLTSQKKPPDYKIISRIWAIQHFLYKLNLWEGDWHFNSEIRDGTFIGLSILTPVREKLTEFISV